MRFFATAVSVALAAFAAVANCQASTKANALTSPGLNADLKAGQKVTISWMNIQGAKVNLDLMDGPTNGLKVVKSIVAGIDNTGTYTWTVPDDVPTSTTYAIRIAYDQNPNNFNYSDRFTVETSFVATATTSGATTSAASTSSEASTTSEATSTSASSAATTSSAETTSTGNSTTTQGTSTMGTSTTRRSSSSGSSSTSEPTSTGAPPSAGSTTISSPLAVIMAVLAAALFLH